MQSPAFNNVRSFVSNPWVQFAFGAVVLVVGWKMNAVTANLLLVAAWVILVWSWCRGLSSWKVLPRTSLTTVFALGSGLLIYYFLWSPFEPAETPYIYAQLAIQPSQRDTARLRLKLENGAAPIENVRIVTKAVDYAHLEFKPVMLRMLPPGGKLSHLLNEIPFRLEECRKVVTEVYYDAKANGHNRHLIASFVFVLQAEDIRDQTLDPEISTYQEGMLDEQQMRDLVIEGFGESEGSMVFVLSEKNNDNSWNIVSLKNRQRHYVFNPQIKRIFFDTKTASNRLVSISVPIPKEQPKHISIVTWSPFGGSAGIDGVQKTDFDPGHEPK